MRPRLGAGLPTPGDSARFRLPTLRLAALSAVVAACAGPTTTGFVIPSEAVVFGTIRDTTGAPQPNAQFEILLYSDRCDRPNPLLTAGPRAAPDGNYRQEFLGPNRDNVVTCATVRAIVQTTNAVLSGSTSGPILVFRLPAAGPPDSVRIDVVVR